MRNKLIFGFLIATLLFLVPSQTNAQAAEVDVTASVVNKYVWRGTELSDAPSVQADVSGTLFNTVTLGLAPTYPLSSTTLVSAEEHLFYGIVGVGQYIELGVWDTYNPDVGISFTKFDRDTGAHNVEATATVSYKNTSLLGARYFWGGWDGSYYVELGQTLGSDLEDGQITLFAGAGNNIYTLANGSDWELVNVGATIAKGHFASTYILNLDTKVSHFVIAVNF